MNIDLLEYRLYHMYNMVKVSDCGEIICQRELVGQIESLKLFILFIYPNDHNQPHFHIKSAGIDACFYIDTCEILIGSIDMKKYKKIKYRYESEKKNMENIWTKLNEKTIKMKIQSIDSIVKELSLDYPKLSDYELLTLAIQERKNQILISAFNVSAADNYPSALASIAIQLGYGPQFSQTLIDVLKK